MKPKLKILTLQASADILGYKSTKSVKNLIKNGYLEACRIGGSNGQLRVVKKSLDMYIENEIAGYQEENGLAKYNTIKEN